MIPYTVENVLRARSPRVAKLCQGHEQNAAVNNGIILLLITKIKAITPTFHRSFYECFNN